MSYAQCVTYRKTCVERMCSNIQHFIEMRCKQTFNAQFLGTSDMHHGHISVCERLIKITIHLNVLVMSQKKMIRYDEKNGKTSKCKCLMCRISISHKIFLLQQKSPIGGIRMKISYSHLVDESICSFGSHHFYLLIQFFFFVCNACVVEYIKS